HVLRTQFTDGSQAPAERLGEPQEPLEPTLRIDLVGDRNQLQVAIPSGEWTLGICSLRTRAAFDGVLAQDFSLDAPVEHRVQKYDVGADRVVRDLGAECAIRHVNLASIPLANEPRDLRMCDRVDLDGSEKCFPKIHAAPILRWLRVRLMSGHLLLVTRQEIGKG